MLTIFVHGVADTYRLWDDVRNQLTSLDTVALALPGFDEDVPEGFRADKESYVDWVIDELERSSAPVDLVGHDWGAILALRVASLRPDLIRTVAAGNGPISSDYECISWPRLGRLQATVKSLCASSTQMR